MATVLVSNGVHYVNPTILIINGITWKASTERPHHTGRRGARRVATISHSNALMRGFTIQNGNSSYGGGVYIASNAMSQPALSAIITAITVVAYI